MTQFTAFMTLLAQNNPPAGGQQGGPEGFLGGMLPMFLIMGVMFYFLLIRPQQRQRKEQQQRVDSLKPGAKVVTIGGLHGLVHNVKERTVVLKIAEGTMVEFEKSAIASVQSNEATKA